MSLLGNAFDRADFIIYNHRFKNQTLITDTHHLRDKFLSCGSEIVGLLF